MIARALPRTDAGAAVAQSWLASALLGAALLLGGGGSPAPLPELIVQLIAAALFAIWLASSRNRQRIPRAAWLIVALVVSVPLVQLVPLPPSIWQAMAGRELAREALALIGAENGWRTWSLDPARTMAALLAMGPPLALLTMTAALDRSGRIALIGVVCAVALLTLVVGALQLSSGAAMLSFYGPSDKVLLGFQANRNSTADLLLIAIVAVPTLVVELARRGRFPLNSSYVIGTSLTGMALAILGEVLTVSRTGLVLIPLALLAGAIVLRSWLGTAPRRLVWAGLAAAIVLAAAAWLLWDTAALTRLTSRMNFGKELRPELWRDGLYAARQYFPWGTGMGNFVPAILAGERLEVVRETMPNRAHNDFLELAVEAGVFGLAAMAAVVTILAAEARRALRLAARGAAAMQVFGIAGLGLLALHSLVDYPMRSMALASLGAVCAGLLLAQRSDPVEASPSHKAEA